MVSPGPWVDQPSDRNLYYQHSCICSLPTADLGFCKPAKFYEFLRTHTSYNVYVHTLLILFLWTILTNAIEQCIQWTNVYEELQIIPWIFLSSFCCFNNIKEAKKDDLPLQQFHKLAIKQWNHGLSLWLNILTEDKCYMESKIKDKESLFGGWRCSSVVTYLYTMHKPLDSVPSTAKQNFFPILIHINYDYFHLCIIKA